MDAVLGRLGDLGPWAYAIVGVLAFLEASWTSVAVAAVVLGAIMMLRRRSMRRAVA